MFTKDITYTDYNGDKQTETCYFNLNRTELMDIALDLPEGIIEQSGDEKEASIHLVDKLGTKGIIEQSGDEKEASIHLVDKLGTKGIFNFIKDVVRRSYGIKSEDGRRFIKSEQIALEFTQTPMYDSIISEFTHDDKAASDFINNVIPAEYINEQINKNKK